MKRHDPVAYMQEQFEKADSIGPLRATEFTAALVRAMSFEQRQVLEAIVSYAVEERNARQKER